MTHLRKGPGRDVPARLVWPVVLVVFALATAIFCAPLFERPGYWGQNSWDQYLGWNGVPRLTLSKYKQLPLWNPYEAGGNVMLAHPGLVACACGGARAQHVPKHTACVARRTRAECR